MYGIILKHNSHTEHIAFISFWKKSYVSCVAIVLKNNLLLAIQAVILCFEPSIQVFLFVVQINFFTANERLSHF